MCLGDNLCPRTVHQSIDQQIGGLNILILFQGLWGYIGGRYIGRNGGSEKCIFPKSQNE